MRIILEIDPELLPEVLGSLETFANAFVEAVESTRVKEQPGRVHISGWPVQYTPYAGFPREWQDFCAKYKINIRTYRAVDRAVGNETQLTLGEFLAAGREYWMTFRNIGEKSANDIEKALVKWLKNGEANTRDH